MRMLFIFFIMSAIFSPANSADPAPDITIALTDDFIRVDTNFAGAQITLFGAITGVDNPSKRVDIISVVRGPQTHFKIRRIEQQKLIWMPGEAHLIESAPGLYLTNATRLISDIAPLPDQARHHLGAEFLNISSMPALPSGESDVSTPASLPETGLAETEADKELFTKVFLEEIDARGLYHDFVGGVEFKKGGLFTINVDLPANTPVGDYNVSVYLYRNGALLAQDSADLTVNKVGIERQIYDLAHTRPVSYGIFCVALSLLAGWIAALAFRK